ncbi:MAG: hypothetical protein JEZ11_25550 [Desulfobacterales bacterium]|nr:hypothetical protein [Desulfobacterales bacterium]
MPTQLRNIVSLTAAIAWLFIATGPAGAQCLQGDCANGTGVYLWPDGSRYEGGFKDNNFHGQGTYHWADGKKYIGAFRDNKRNGHGTYSWPNGSRYSGQWKDGARHGQGTFSWANGSRYEGEWYEGQKQGLGIYTYPDGNRNAGRWAAGKITDPMDPDVVAIQLARPAAPSPSAPVTTELPMQPADSGAMTQTPLPLEKTATPENTEKNVTGEKPPTAAVEKAVRETEAEVEEPDLPASFALAVHQIPLVRNGTTVQSEGIPLYPRGRSRAVATCRLSVDKTGGDDRTGVVNLAVENRTGCRFTLEAYLRQNDTYLKLVAWSGEETIEPKGSKSLQETVSLPKPLTSTDLTLKVQGAFQGCP